MTSIEVLPDLEAWLNHEVEKPCDTEFTETGPCQNRAEYVAYLRFECGCPPGARLICEECKEYLEQGRYGCRACRTCHVAVATWIERYRRAS